MMEYEILSTADATTRVARFLSPSGVGEVHLTVLPKPGSTFESQVNAVLNAYAQAQTTLGLSADSAVFRRVFLSDAANQAAYLRHTALMGGGAQGPVAVSIVEQPPLPESKLALLAYHQDALSGLNKEAVPNGVRLSRGALSHLWTAELTASPAAPSALKVGADAASQTRALFGRYDELLDQAGASLAHHGVRTWLFVQNVDVNYRGMVQARAAHFEAQGLTAKTHYLASTGIEGRSADPTQVVLMDAYALAGARPGQIRWMHAPEHLGPTHLYGVTFERGALVAFGDRAHALISGTASIDPAGHTLYLGDIQRQVERTFLNIEALLASVGARASDLAHLIVYLRDLADRPVVEAFLAAHYPQVPTVLVLAPVCRPDWLVEAEGVAIIPTEHPGLAAF